MNAASRVGAIVDAKRHKVEGVGRVNTGVPVRDGWKPTDKRIHRSMKVVLFCRHRQMSKDLKW